MTFQPFKRSKSKSKGAFKSFAGLDGKRRREPRELPPPTPAKEEAPQVRSEGEDDLAQALGDEQWARDIRRLQQRNPNSTVIEMLAMDWLDKNLAKYVYQARVNGGYRPGGNVPDFVVRTPDNEWMALLVNGNYWHNVPGTQNDQTDKLRLVGSYYEGARIKNAVILWESRMMQGRSQLDALMNDALSGVEHPP